MEGWKALCYTRCKGWREIVSESEGNTVSQEDDRWSSCIMTDHDIVGIAKNYINLIIPVSLLVQYKHVLIFICNLHVRGRRK